MIHDIVLPLLLGLAVFLFGMKVMEMALGAWAGPYLKQALERFTATPLRGLISGTLITAALQSSSAVTVITIGLVNAGILTFSRTLGIILGANIGTCLTTELIGLNLGNYALPLLILSAVLWMCLIALDPGESVSRTRRLPGRIYKWIRPAKFLSVALAGFACILLGMEMMSSIVPALQAKGLFAWFLDKSQTSLAWGLLAGICLTAIIQSSAAVVAITMGLASVHAFPMDLSIAITLGANIGTCTTGLIASIGGSRSGRFVAWAQVLLNVGGTLICFPFIPALSMAAAFLTANPAGQVAHAQTLFNIICSLIALPLCYMRPLMPRQTP